MSTENRPVYIISDEPEGDSDLFGFDAYAKAIAAVVISFGFRRGSTKTRMRSLLP